MNIKDITIRNKHYRRVLYTDKRMQLAVMSLKKSENELGMEVHPKTTQYIKIESGTGKAIVGRKTQRLQKGTSVIIPAGVRHNIVNTSRSNKPLKMYTIYSPPEHPKDTVHKTKQDESS